MSTRQTIEETLSHVNERLEKLDREYGELKAQRAVLVNILDTLPKDKRRRENKQEKGHE